MELRLPGAVTPPVETLTVLPLTQDEEEQVSLPPTIETRPHLIIPKLTIDVPITWDVDGFTEATYLEALTQGVAHFQGTAKPGEAGNIFFFGHSGYTKSLPNGYHKIFRTLDRLAIGDDLTIIDESRVYRYRVVSERQVEPDDLSILESTPTETVTLMTCWPPGTLDRRLIIQAERVLET